MVHVPMRAPNGSRRGGDPGPGRRAGRRGLRDQAVRPRGPGRSRAERARLRRLRMIEDDLVSVLSTALEAAAPGLGIGGDLPTPELLVPKQREHGDFATNVALGLATRAGKPPREVAQAIVDALPPAPFLEKVEVAGPGFLNLFTTDDWLHDVVRAVIADGDAYGLAEPHGRRAQVEFVSANPTGPLTVAHARNAAIGDALARLLEATGWSVEREYYFNDAGGQMDRFGASIEARLPAARRARRAGARGRVSRRLHRGTRPGHPRDGGSRPRRSARRRTLPPLRAEGVRTGAAVDRGDPRPVRRALRRLLPGVRARGEG